MELEIVCVECGEVLDATFEKDEDGCYLEVEPCSVCLEGAEMNGYDSGYSEGYDEGESDAETAAEEAKEQAKE